MTERCAETILAYGCQLTALMFRFQHMCTHTHTYTYTPTHPQTHTQYIYINTHNTIFKVVSDIEWWHRHMQAYTHTYTPLTSKVTDILHLMAGMGQVKFYTSAWSEEWVVAPPSRQFRWGVSPRSWGSYRWESLQPQPICWYVTHHTQTMCKQLHDTLGYIQYGENQSPVYNIDRGQCLCLNTHSVSDACEEKRKRWGSNLQ